MVEIFRWPISIQGLPLYADLQNFLTSVDEQYEEKINQMRTECKGKAP